MGGHVAVGMGLRKVYEEELLALDDVGALDVLEVMIDEALHPDRDRARRASWRKLGTRWPLIAHGTELGIGDADGLDAHYVGHIQEATASLHVHWYSEHLAFLRGGGVDLGHFAPVFDDPDSLTVLAENAAEVRAGLRCPFLLENPADVTGYGSACGEARGRAFNAALEAAECGALLDLTNLVLDARNDGYDVGPYLDVVNMERVVEIHLAGGRRAGTLWIDSHDHPVDEEALRWLREVVPRAPNLRAVIIERDDRLPPLSQMLAEVDEVRRVVQEASQ